MLNRPTRPTRPTRHENNIPFDVGPLWTMLVATVSILPTIFSLK